MLVAVIVTIFLTGFNDGMKCFFSNVLGFVPFLFEPTFQREGVWTVQFDGRLNSFITDKMSLTKEYFV